MATRAATKRTTGTTPPSHLFGERGRPGVIGTPPWPELSANPAAGRPRRGALGPAGSMVQARRAHLRPGWLTCRCSPAIGSPKGRPRREAGLPACSRSPTSAARRARAQIRSAGIAPRRARDPRAGRAAAGDTHAGTRRCTIPRNPWPRSPPCRVQARPRRYATDHRPAIMGASPGRTNTSPLNSSRAAMMPPAVQGPPGSDPYVPVRGGRHPQDSRPRASPPARRPRGAR